MPTTWKSATAPFSVATKSWWKRPHAPYWLLKPERRWEKLLFKLTNLGHPYITVTDANYENRGELYLKHRFDGVEIRQDYARATLENLFKIWTRPVHIETIFGEVTVARSSGALRLDQAAVHAVRRAAPFPPAPDTLEDEWFRVGQWITFDRR